MVEIAEMRGFITVVSFLGILVVLMAWIPAQFYVASDIGRTVSTPDVFESVQIMSFAETWNYQMNETGGFTFGEQYQVTNDGLDIGNRDFTFHYSQANKTHHDIGMQINWNIYLFIPQWGYMTWINQQTGTNHGDTLSATEIQADADLQEDNNNTVRYRVQWVDFEYVGIFGYNQTLYGNFTHAWNFHGLFFFWACNFDEVSTSYNAFHLITMLLFFKLPMVHWVVNAIMAIPLWVAIAILIISFVLMVVRAIGGLT